MDFRGCEGIGALFWVSHLYPGSTRSFKTMPSMRIHLLGGVTWFLCPNMGICDVNKSHGLNTRCWLVETISAALWLVGTQWSPIHYSCWWKLSQFNSQCVAGRLNSNSVLDLLQIKSLNLVIEKLLYSFDSSRHACSSSFCEQSKPTINLRLYANFSDEHYQLHSAHSFLFKVVFSFEGTCFITK